MFSGGQRSIAPQYHVTDESLRVRPYNQALTTLTHKLCAQVGQPNSDRCLFEARTAFDCLLRQKVQKFGDITDNVGACKHHIASMKESLGHPQLLERHIEELTHLRHSFV